MLLCHLGEVAPGIHQYGLNLQELYLDRAGRQLFEHAPKQTEMALQIALTEAQDDLISARRAPRNMIRGQNRTNRCRTLPSGDMRACRSSPGPGRPQSGDGGRT